MRIVFFFLALCLSINTFHAQDSNSLFEKANDYAASGAYSQAVESYQQLLKSGVESAEVEYNLANSYLALNKTGEAILHYERAIRIEPGDKDIQQNLRLAKEKIDSDIALRPRFFISEAWDKLKMSASSELWSALSLLLFWSGISGLIVWQIGKSRQQRKQGFFAGLSLLLLALFPFFLGMSKASIEQDSRAGIITKEKIELYTAATDNSPTIRQIPLGEKVFIQDKINDWFKVELQNGEAGWLPIHAFEKI